MAILVWFYIIGFIVACANLVGLAQQVVYMWQHKPFAWASVCLFLSHFASTLLLGLLAFAASVAVWGDPHLAHLSKGGLRGAGYTAVSLMLLEGAVIMAWRLWPVPPNHSNEEQSYIPTSGETASVEGSTAKRGRGRPPTQS